MAEHLLFPSSILFVTSITQSVKVREFMASAGLLDLVFSRDFKMVLGAWWKDELEREPQLKNVLAKSNAKMEQLLGM